VYANNASCDRVDRVTTTNDTINRTTDNYQTNYHHYLSTTYGADRLYHTM